MITITVQIDTKGRCVLDYTSENCDCAVFIPPKVAHDILNIAIKAIADEELLDV